MTSTFRRRRPGPGWVRGVCFGTTLLAVAALGGCAEEPVTLTSPEVSDEDLATCNEFLADLPDRLANQDRRKVDPATALGRAWGDPAIVVRCGVGVPADFDVTSSCEEANGVGWFVPEDQIDDQDADVVLTAVGYRPIVEVDVPHQYRPEGSAAAIAQLAKPVTDHLREVNDCQ